MASWRPAVPAKLLGLDRDDLVGKCSTSWHEAGENQHQPTTQQRLLQRWPAAG